MPIYKRGNTWWYSITLNGKTFRGSCKTQDEKQANEFHDLERAKLWRTEQVGDKPRRTWSETVERWMSEHQHKKSIVDDKRSAAFWTDAFAKKNVQYITQITPDLVKEIRDAEVGRKKLRGEGKVQATTVNRKIAFLRSVINAAHREYQWLETCPLFRMFEEKNERVRYLEPHEIHRLTNALPEPYSSALAFSVATGLRRGNVFGLRWSQVNLAKRIVTFPGQIMKNGMPLSLPLSESAITVLRSWIGKHTEYVFVRQDGQPAKEVPSKTWKAALKQAGIENFRFHDARHTWASLMRQGGVTLDVLQELGGWQSSQMVQRYAHLSVDHLSKHAQMIDSMMGFGGQNAGTVQILHNQRTGT